MRPPGVVLLAAWALVVALLAAPSAAQVLAATFRIRFEATEYMFENPGSSSPVSFTEISALDTANAPLPILSSSNPDGDQPVERPVFYGFDGLLTTYTADLNMEILPETASHWEFSPEGAFAGYRIASTLSEPLENPVTWFVEEDIGGDWVVRDFRAYQRLPSFSSPLAPGEYSPVFELTGPLNEESEFARPFDGSVISTTEFAKAPFGEDPLGSVSCGLSQSLPGDHGAMWFSTTPSAGSNTTWLDVTLTTDAPNTQMLAAIAVYVNGACVASAIGQYESPLGGGEGPDNPAEPDRIRNGGLEGDADHPVVTFAYQPADGPITVAVMSAQGDDGYFELVATAVVGAEPTTPPPTTTVAPLVAYDQTCDWGSLSRPPYCPRNCLIGSGPEKEPDNCLLTRTIPLTYADAAAACQDEPSMPPGTFLVSLRSSEELEAMVNITSDVSVLGAVDFWIGLPYDMEVSPLVFEDGTELDWEPTWGPMGAGDDLSVMVTTNNQFRTEPDTAAHFAVCGAFQPSSIVRTPDGNTVSFLLFPARASRVGADLAAAAPSSLNYTLLSVTTVPFVGLDSVQVGLFDGSVVDSGTVAGTVLSGAVADGTRITVEPSPNFVGTVAIVFTSTNGTAVSAPSVCYVDVDAENDPPEVTLEPTRGGTTLVVGDTREGIKLRVNDDSAGVPGSQTRVAMTLTGVAPARLVIVNNNGLTTLNSTGKYLTFTASTAFLRQLTSGAIAVEADPDVQASLNLTVTVCDFGWSNAGQALADMECTVSGMPVLIESTTSAALSTLSVFGNEVPRLRIHVLPRDLHGNVRPVVSDTYVAKLDRGAPGIETLAACELNTDWSEVHPGIIVQPDPTVPNVHEVAEEEPGCYRVSLAVAATNRVFEDLFAMVVPAELSLAASLFNVTGGLVVDSGGTIIMLPRDQYGNVRRLSSLFFDATLIDATNNEIDIQLDVSVNLAAGTYVMRVTPLPGAKVGLAELAVRIVGKPSMAFLAVDVLPSCLSGAYINTEAFQCDACAPNTYGATKNALACTDCPGNATSLAASKDLADCTCPPDMFTTALRPGTPCVACPPGGSCAGGSARPISLPGYYPAAGNFSFVECSNSESCLGNSTCAEGYEGYVCGSCQEDYFRIGNECKACPANNGLVFLLGAAASVAFCFVLTCLAHRSRNTDYNYLATASISFNALQLVALFGTMNLAWPDFVIKWYNALSVVNFSLELLSPECQFQTDLRWSAKWLMGLLLPVYVALVFVFCFGVLAIVRAVVAKCGPCCRDRYPNLTVKPPRTEVCDHCCYVGFKALTLPADLKRLLHSSIRGYLFFLLLAFVNLCRNVLDYFNCRENEDFEMVLYADSFVKCGEGAHRALLVPAILGVIVYVVGIPASLLYILRYKRRKNPKKFFHRFGFVTSRYIPTRYWWEIVVIIRKFFAIVTIVFLRFIPSLQATLTIVVLFVAFGVHVYNRPFKLTHHNVVESIAIAASFLILYAGQLGAVYFEDVTSTFRNVLIALVMVVGMVAILGAMCYDLAKWCAHRSNGTGEDLARDWDGTSDDKAGRVRSTIGSLSDLSGEGGAHPTPIGTEPNFESFNPVFGDGDGDNAAGLGSAMEMDSLGGRMPSGIAW